MRVQRLFNISGCLFLLGVAVFSAYAEERPWWDDFPIIVSSDNLAVAQMYSATIGFCGSQNDPSWGIYFQQFANRPDLTQAFHDAGLPAISYFETFGTSTCFIGELGPRINGITKLLTSHWSWQIYGGGPIKWIGVNNYWDDEEYARPYTYTHPRYGSPRLTYPDGTPGTGYNGPETDPRNSRVFDACTAKDIYGNMLISFEYNGAVNAIDPDTGSPMGPLTSLLQTPDGYAGHVSFCKDSACPYWADYAYASALLAADNGSDGMWTDNFSPWDSFGHPPLVNAFGDWSVAGFRTYLADHFTPESLQAMGVTDVQTFDIRSALRDKARAWGGDDTNIWDGVWLDPRWRSDSLWHAYEIYKRQVGTAALSNYYNRSKAAANLAGKSNFFIAGNDIPFFSLGWPRGDLDMVSTEMSAGWHMGSGSRGVMMPPVGRFAPVYKLAREHARSRFVNVWFYVDDAYLGKPGIASVLEYEMLATHSLPMIMPDVPRVAGTAESNAAFGRFVKKVRPLFRDRMPREEIGVYYSSSSVLAFMTPGGFMNMDRQPHAFAVFGWATALGELHYQYRIVPEWKLTPETLAALRVLIIPDAEVLEPHTVTDIIAPWVQNGGALIVTGNCGARLGESGNFASNSDGSPLAPLLQTPPANVLHITENIGLDYYLSSTGRTPLLPQFNVAVEQVTGAGQLLFDAADVPTTIGLTMYEDAAKHQLFIDANNMDIDLAGDIVRPTQYVSFTAAAPEWLGDKPYMVKVVSPDAETPTAVVVRNTEGRLQVMLSPFALYMSVAIQADTDGDGLSDYDEAKYGSNPEVADTDNDGLTDGDEVYLYGTSPVNADTDGDGVPDNVELYHGSDPTDPNDPANTPAGSIPVLALAAILLLAAALRAPACFWKSNPL